MRRGRKGGREGGREGRNEGGRTLAAGSYMFIQQDLARANLTGEGWSKSLFRRREERREEGEWGEEVGGRGGGRD